jgi:outer membrane protein assembly factor BamB
MLSNVGPSNAAAAWSFAVPPAVSNDTYSLDGLSVAADGTAYVTSLGSASSLTAVGDGPAASVVWQRPDASGTPVIGADGTIYVLGGATFDAVDPADGSTVWAAALSAPAVPAAVGPDGTIYAVDLGSVDPEKLHAMNPDGSLAWSYPLPSYDGFQPAPVVVAPDGTIYLTNSGGDRAALHPDGSAIWSVPWPSAVLDVSALALGPDGTLYQLIDGALYAFDPKDGSQIWNVGTYLEWFENPTVGADGTIYVAGTGYDSTSALYLILAYHPDGTLWWKYSGSQSVTTTPVVDGAGTLYAADSGCHYSFGNWSCLPGATGTLLRFDAQPAGQDLTATPALSAPLPGTVRYGGLAFRGGELLVPVDPRGIVGVP